MAKRYTEVGGVSAATAAVAAAKLGAGGSYWPPCGAMTTPKQPAGGTGTRVTPYNPPLHAGQSSSAIMVDAKGERIIVNYPSPDLFA